jgi:imidazolonepropionase-like amidohydrolase
MACPPIIWSRVPLADSASTGGGRHSRHLSPWCSRDFAQALSDLQAMQAAGVKLAIATDHNPGSSPLYSLVLALQLAIALGGIRCGRGLIAGTAHAADALGQPTGGWPWVAPADFIVIQHERALAALPVGSITAWPFVYCRKGQGTQIWINTD